MFKDSVGQTILTPDNRPPGSGTPVKILSGNGEIRPGTMIGGSAVPNKPPGK